MTAATGGVVADPGAVAPIVTDTGVGVLVGRGVGTAGGVDRAVGDVVPSVTEAGVGVRVGRLVGVAVGRGVDVAVGRGAAVGRAISRLLGCGIGRTVGRGVGGAVGRGRGGAGGTGEARCSRRCRLPRSLLATRRSQDAPAGTRAAPLLATRWPCSHTCTAWRTRQMAYRWPFLCRTAKVAISGVVRTTAGVCVVAGRTRPGAPIA